MAGKGFQNFIYVVKYVKIVLRRVEIVKTFWKGDGAWGFSKQSRIEGTSVSTPILGNATSTAKYFEHTVAGFRNGMEK